MVVTNILSAAEWAVLLQFCLMSNSLFPSSFTHSDNAGEVNLPACDWESMSPSMFVYAADL